ncbi:MAG TPA: hypothetical protein VMT61_15185 [Candidatus Binataceae bacterium]|nr:hypothetical protein [Candidatus Binataceae bacterium]
MRVRKTAKMVLGGLMAATLGIVMVPRASHAARRAAAAASVDPLVAYYDVGDDDNAPGIDNTVRLVNPTKANGSLCAMIYVFDSDEELGACCGCPLSPNKLDPLSVKNDLLCNWALAGPKPKSGVITVVPAASNVSKCSNGACNTDGVAYCDPTAGYTETPTLNAWITHAEILTGYDSQSIGGASTVPFTSDATDAAEQTYLTNTCQGIISNGSGYGACDCGAFLDSSN